MKEPHVYMRSENIDVAERRISQTCNRTAVMQKLSHFVSAFSHYFKPLTRHDSQFPRMLFHPRINSGIALPGAVKSQQFRSHLAPLPAFENPLLHGALFFRFRFLVRNFDGFRLPRSRPGQLQGQTRTRSNLVLKLARFDVEASMSDLAPIVRTYNELPVAGVVPQARDILPANLLFTSPPGTRSNAIHFDGQNRRVSE